MRDVLTTRAGPCVRCNSFDAIFGLYPLTSVLFRTQDIADSPASKIRHFLVLDVVGLLVGACEDANDVVGDRIEERERLGD